MKKEKEGSKIFHRLIHSLAIYGGLCMICGVTPEQLRDDAERTFKYVSRHVTDHIAEAVTKMIFKEQPIEVEYKEVE